MKPVTTRPYTNAAQRAARRMRYAASAVLPLVAMLVFSGVAVAAPGGKSAATIEATPFTDSCRDVSFHSTKDISHVLIHYVDGRVVRVETIESPDYAIDGRAGDEIGSVDVKSGTTTETFTCSATNSPPSAVLEIRTSGCVLAREDPELWHCREANSPRSVWEDLGGDVGFGCPNPSNAPCDTTFHFRGTSSSDPDGDIVSWSIEFADFPTGAIVAATGGSWVADPPIEVVHTIPPEEGARFVTLTVTDSVGQSDSDTMTVFFSYPD